jgi:hypothetical protein
MKPTYPTRNEARGILQNLAKASSISKNELTAYCILLYERKHEISFSTFVFTNALVDMFPEMNVENENTIETSTITGGTPSTFFRGKLSNSDIDDFFKKTLGSTFEDWIDKINNAELVYNVKISTNGSRELNSTWFNNSDKFIHPLLNSYQSFKRNKGMLFQKEDIKQIPIDYSVVLCYNHFVQAGYLNKDIVSEIIRTLTDAANDCINTEPLKYDDIEYNVSKDLSRPKSIKAAFDFIKQL